METMVNSTGSKGYKYFAFISYKTEDLSEAWNLKKKLDDYRLPAKLCPQNDKKRRPTHEAFLDKTNIQPGELTKELRENLDNSHYLIVVCSPRSAKSEYVTAEIEWFTRNGREKEMFLFVIESGPNNIDASFNPAIREAERRWSERDGEERKLLAVNIKEKDVDKLFFSYRLPMIGAWLQRERAYMQLISALLGLDFKQLWSCQKIRIVERVAAWIAGVIFVLAALFSTWYLNQPVDVRACLKEASFPNDSLPALKDAIVTIRYGNKTEVDTIHSVNDSVVFKEIAHKHLNKEAWINVVCKDFLDVDTTIVLTKNVVLNLYRDPTVFGDVHFRLWNPETEKPVAKAVIELAGQTVTSDDSGHVSLFIPLKSQRKTYHVKASVPLANDTIYLPCGPDDVLQTK